jgi:hypothetical protein
MKPANWDIGRRPRPWSQEVSDDRLYRAPEKIEFVGGIFAGHRERLTVLAMILEAMGIDAAVGFGRLEDWKAAVAERERQEAAGTFIPPDV